MYLKHAKQIDARYLGRRVKMKEIYSPSNGALMIENGQAISTWFLHRSAKLESGMPWIS